MFNTLILLALIFHAPTFCIASDDNDCENQEEYQEGKIISKILGSNYNKNVKPGRLGKNGSEPVRVIFNLYIRSIDHLDDVNMELSLQITLRQVWNDSRLRYNASVPYVTIVDPSRIWVPDLVTINEKLGKIHSILSSNQYIRIYPNGTLLYSARVSIVLKCPMNFKWYPFDLPMCPMIFSSYSLTTRDILFFWNDPDPVQSVKAQNVELPKFTFMGYDTRSDFTDSGTGVYSRLHIILKFKRQLSYYITQIYLPCSMLVLVSWLGFWLDESAIDARISLAITSLLAMVTQIYGINQLTPAVSYTKAIDFFTAVCESLIFAALIEFSVVNYAFRAQIQNNKTKKEKKAEATHKNSVSPKIFISISDCADNKFLFSRGLSRAKRIDIIARFLFPMIFIAFNVVYWTVCVSYERTL